MPASASQRRQRPLRLGRLEADHLEPLGLGGDPDRLAVRAARPRRGGRRTPRRRRSRGRSRTRRRPSRGRRRRRCEAVGGDRAAGVERAVDRVDHDPRLAAVAEGDLAALLGDGDEGGALARPAARARRRRRPRSGGRSPGCGRRPRRPPRRRCAPRCVRGRVEDRALGGDDAAADPRPVCGENVHRPDARAIRRASVGRCARSSPRPRPPRPASASARSPTATGRCWSSAPPAPARPSCWRGAWRGWSAPGPRPSACW